MHQKTNKKETVIICQSLPTTLASLFYPSEGYFQDVYCNFLNLLVNMIALCFWVNQFLIALIRWRPNFCHQNIPHFKCFCLQHFLSRRAVIIKICLSRFAYVKFPVEFHNRFPTQKEKSVLFFKLTRSD